MSCSRRVICVVSTMSCANCFRTHAAKPAAKKVGKKVTFNSTVSIIYFNKAPKDDNICWQRAARDRMRFKRRIHDVEQRIGWVFTPQHRCRMYVMLYL